MAKNTSKLPVYRDPKPKRIRGYKIKKEVWTNPDGKFIHYERVPRSGFGSAFFSLFTLFLAILVLFNLVGGGNYKSYKAIVTVAYGVTESVGEVVLGVAKKTVNIVNIIQGARDETTEDVTVSDETVTIFAKLVVLTKDDIRIVVAQEEWTDRSANPILFVYRSNDDEYKEGDKVDVRWFFGWTLVSLEDDSIFKKKIRYMSREIISYDEYMKGETNDN